MTQPDFAPVPYSVVIATLGGPTLARTIASLNSTSLPPQEILVCIPAAEASRTDGLSAPNLRIVVTAVRGQVAQRATGFAEAANALVLQMDDDMLPAHDCVERLMRALLALGDKAAVAPLLVDVETGRSVYRQPARRAWVNRAYYWLLNGGQGYRPGGVDLAGTPSGIDHALATGALLETDWLPGGCALHRKQNLVLDHFFPYPGKAYCEDLIHSQHLRQRGVRLFVDTGAHCALEVIFTHDADWREYLRGLKGDLRARRYFMSLSGRRSPRMWFFYGISLASYLAKRVRGALNA